MFWGLLHSSYAQFAPPAGQAGTTAVHKDSVAIVSWAETVVDFTRGAADIANGWSTLAAFGDSTESLGYAQGNSSDVLSLGDSGSITLSFPFPVMNGPGNDFAVFENSFSDDYLEFAFVEVSSDGVNFVRFPAVSYIPASVQTASFGYSNTGLVHNLAGKYRQGYGTPFDLEDLVDSANINLDSILYIRITDVIGTVDPLYATYDSEGNMINDPYPTDFDSGGFDLDGVGVINENNIFATSSQSEIVDFSLFPNPSNGNFSVVMPGAFEIQIFDSTGRIVFRDTGNQAANYELTDLLDSGIYTVRFVAGGESSSALLVIQK